jgi:hypothetical protein
MLLFYRRLSKKCHLVSPEADTSKSEDASSPDDLTDVPIGYAVNKDKKKQKKQQDCGPPLIKRSIHT